MFLSNNEIFVFSAILAISVMCFFLTVYFSFKFFQSFRGLRRPKITRPERDGDVKKADYIEGQINPVVYFLILAPPLILLTEGVFIESMVRYLLDAI